MKHTRFAPALILVLVASPALPAPPTEFIGSYYKTPEQKAMDCYARGVKAKRKAEAEKDPEKQSKLYLKAKEELSKSVGYLGHYDGYLALGQVYLALGQSEAAFDACTQAQRLKPGDAAATACVEEARKRTHNAQQGSGQ